MLLLRVLNWIFVHLIPATVLAGHQMLAGQPAFAVDFHDAFLNGLRERGYYDTALDYLDSVEKDTRAADDLLVTLDLERAAIWQSQGRAARRADLRDDALARAESTFRNFAERHPDHERAPWANSQAGQLLFERARRILWERDPDATPEEADRMADQARRLIAEARGIHERAFKEFDAQLRSMPFADRDEDPDGWQRRRQVETRYAGAWMARVNCSFEEALTYDRSRPERKQLLNEARNGFEEIRNYDRESVLGLQAQLMLGRCHQELDEISVALGHFNELRAQTSNNELVRHLSMIAQYCRLICLNHESRKNHDLVVSESRQWLSDHEAEQNSVAGLGIRYERARAEEAIAQSLELGNEQRDLQFRLALADAEQVGQVASPVRPAAIAMARRLRAQVDEKKRSDPRDFESALQQAREQLGSLQAAIDRIRTAESDDARRQAEQERDLIESDATRLFQLALQLRTARTDPSEVAQARYLLSYLHLQGRRYFDALVLSRHVMRQHREDAEETAEDASDIAVSAAVQAWIDAPEDDRDFEVRLIREVCREVIETFPGSPKATEARLRLGRVYRDLGDPVKAAEVFLQVPESDGNYSTARMEAGQAYFLAWARASGEAADSDVPKATQEEWKQQALSLLVEGIGLTREQLGNAPPPDTLLRAEVSVASIMNLSGEFEATVSRLTDGDAQSVVAAVEFRGQRPKSGTQSAAFAGLVYRTLLRAYVGTQQIEEALNVMDRLESLGSQNTTATYTQLGRELQDELKQLQESGESARAQQVRVSFEQFLERIYEARDPKDYQALVWIGESYYGLGEGMADPTESRNSYERAVTVYEEILDGNLAPDESSVAIQLRLIRAERGLGNFAAAVERARTLLTENPSAVSIQMEAAHTLGDWGEVGEPERLLDAITGVNDDAGNPTVWGWKGLAQRLEKSRRAENWDELRPLFLEARYELARSRYRYARANPGEGRKQLQAAATEIKMMARVSDDIDGAWQGRFDQLYQDIQVALGATPEPLINSDDSDAADGESETTAASQPAVAADDTIQTSPAAPTTQPNQGLLLAAFALVAIALGAVVWVVMKKPKRRRRSARAYARPPASLKLPPELVPGTPVEGGSSGSNSGTSTKSSARSRSEQSRRTPSSGPPARPQPKKPQPDSGSSRTPRRKKRPRPPQQ